MITRRVGSVTSRLAAAAVLLGGLTGCADGLRPGAAAIVDGSVISMSRADDAAAVYCQVAVYSAQQQSAEPLGSADVRRQAVSELIAARVADDLAEQEGLRIPASAWRFDREQRRQVLGALPNADPDLAVDVLEEGQRTYAIAQALGERATGEEATAANADELQAAGREVIAEAIAAADVAVDPRFGLGDDGAQRASTGSLSVAGGALDDAGADVVPSTQQCV